MTRLTILHTNDVHGRVTQLSRIATLARRIRREVTASGGYCVLWDAGDIEDPTLFESCMTKGSAALAILRGASYDLAALGNASIIRYGPQCVPQLAERHVADLRFGRPVRDGGRTEIECFPLEQIDAIAVCAQTEKSRVEQIHHQLVRSPAGGHPAAGSMNIDIPVGFIFQPPNVHIFQLTPVVLSD